MHRTRDHLCLVADLFDLQAVASAAAASDGLSPAACAALRDLYRQASAALRRTLDRLPVAIVNLELEGAVPPGRWRGRAAHPGHRGQRRPLPLIRHARGPAQAAIRSLFPRRGRPAQD